MDDEQVVIQDVAPTGDVTESTPVEETVASAPQAEEPAQEEVVQEEKPKRDAQGRIQQLVSEKKRIQQERDYYAQLAEAASAPLPTEVDPDEYRALRANNNVVAQEVNELKMKLLANELDALGAKVYTDFPELKEQPALDEKLSERWLADYAKKDSQGNIIGYTKSPYDFAKEQMELIKEAQASATAQTAQNLQRQSSEAAITPQINNQPATKDPKDMSIEEMEKAYGVVRQ